MIVQVCIRAGYLTVVDTCTQAESPAAAITQVMLMPAIAAHLHDLRYSGLKAEAKIIERQEVAA